MRAVTATAAAHLNTTSSLLDSCILANSARAFRFDLIRGSSKSTLFLTRCSCFSQLTMTLSQSSPPKWASPPAAQSRGNCLRCRYPSNQQSWRSTKGILYKNGRLLGHQRAHVKSSYRKKHDHVVTAPSPCPAGLSPVDSTSTVPLPTSSMLMSYVPPPRSNTRTVWSSFRLSPYASAAATGSWMRRTTSRPGQRIRCKKVV